MLTTIVSSGDAYAPGTRDSFRGTTNPTIIFTVIVGHSIGTDFYITPGTFDLSVSAYADTRPIACVRLRN